MKINMGNTDRNLRLIAGIAAAALGIYFQSWWGLLAVPLLATALIKWCPAYVPFGLSTCATKSEQKG